MNYQTVEDKIIAIESFVTDAKLLISEHQHTNSNAVQDAVMALLDLIVDARNELEPLYYALDELEKQEAALHDKVIYG